MSSLVDLLKDLGRDAALADEFTKDPDAVLDRYDLTDEERQAVKEGDVDAVKRLSGMSDVRTTHSIIHSYD